MAASVVTFSVQLGSGGYAAARTVAERLKYAYYDWEITSEAAARAGVSPDVVAAAERVPGFIERMLRRLAATPAVAGDEVATVDAASMVTSAVQSLTSEDYRQFIERVVEELAGRGDAVIVGHAGQAILRGRPGVLKVLVHGSHARRSERLATERGSALEDAVTLVKNSDRDRSELFRRVYKMEWRDAAAYDLTFNTDYVPLEVIADAVVAAARAVT